MRDLFLSYSSLDRDLLRPIVEAFVRHGFDVFWDQDIPSGEDWDNWIRRNLADARCAVVFWSSNAVASANVRHEAVIARDQGKLVPCLLAELRAEEFPLGFHTTQALKLVGWKGDGSAEAWRIFVGELERKSAPAWLERRIAAMDSEVKAVRAKTAEMQSRMGAMVAEAEHAATVRNTIQVELSRAHELVKKQRRELAAVDRLAESIDEDGKLPVTFMLPWTGVVQSYDERTGEGLITGDSGEDVVVFRRDLEKAKVWSLRPGQEISYYPGGRAPGEHGEQLPSYALYPRLIPSTTP